MTTALAEAPKPQLQMTNGMMQPTNIDEAFRLAKAIAASGLAPRGFERPESILIAVQLGAELGLRPMQSLQAIAVVNGRATLWGKGLVGIVMASGQLEDLEERFEGSGDDLVSIVTVKRKGVKSPRIGQFSVADAKKAGLWGKNTWASYPRDMLAHKARARAFTIFADVLCGLPVFEDIAEAVTVEDVRPAAPTGNDPLLKKIGAAPAEVIDVKTEEIPGPPDAVNEATLKKVRDAKPKKAAASPKDNAAAPGKEPTSPPPAAQENWTGVVATCLETSNGLFKSMSVENDVFYTRNPDVAAFLSRAAKDKLPVGIDFVTTDGRWMIEQVKAL